MLFLCGKDTLHIISVPLQRVCLQIPTVQASARSLLNQNVTVTRGGLFRLGLWGDLATHGTWSKVKAFLIATTGQILLPASGLEARDAAYHPTMPKTGVPRANCQQCKTEGSWDQISQNANRMEQPFKYPLKKVPSDCSTPHSGTTDSNGVMFYVVRGRAQRCLGSKTGRKGMLNSSRSLN